MGAYRLWLRTQYRRYVLSLQSLLFPQSAADSLKKDAQRVSTQESGRDLVEAKRELLNKEALQDALALPALDSLMVLAALEVRFGKAGRGAHPGALDASSGAFRELVRGLAASPEPTPLLLERLGGAYCEHLDVSYHLTK